MPVSLVSAVCVGASARRALSRAQNAALLGQTSEGIFMRLDLEQVVFLTSDRHRGPLTVNLDRLPTALLGLPVEGELKIEPGFIFFSAANCRLEWEAAATWHPPRPPAPALPDGERKNQLAAAARANVGGAAGFSRLLMGSETDPPALALYQGLKSVLEERRPSAEIARRLFPFFGLGRGLTPSGDDLALGFLLALQRWGGRCRPGFCPAEIGEIALTAARKRTTLLSTSLIAAAVEGLADERLIFALDGLACGNAQVEDCARALASWGSSSGFDALAGFSLVI